MTKKHFIALADAIRDYNNAPGRVLKAFPFDTLQIKALANFCQSSNPNFNRERWLGYIAGENGKNGGKV